MILFWALDRSDTDFLSNANLTIADLHEADLGGANLSFADLTDAKVSKEQLDQVDSLEGATMPDGSKPY